MTAPGRRSIAVLALAVVVAAAVLTWLLVADDDGSRLPGGSSAAGGAVVTSVEAKGAALDAAERATTRVLSYSFRSLEEDQDASRAMLAGEMLEQYDDTMRRIGAETMRTKREVRATVVGSAIISATDQEARALLFVNTETRRQGAQRPRVELTRVVVTLQHDEGGTEGGGRTWRVTALDSL